MKTKYERIRIQGKTWLVSIQSERGDLVLFHRVNKNGEEIIEPKEDGKSVTTGYVVHKSNISRRTPMKMSLTYAELEPA